MHPAAAADGTDSDAMSPLSSTCSLREPSRYTVMPRHPRECASTYA